MVPARRLFLLLLAAAVQPLSGQTAPSPPSDAALHFLAGFSVSLAASSLALFIARGEEPAPAARVAAVSGLAASLLAGGLKEVADFWGAGTPQLQDLLATLAGGLAAAATVYAITRSATRESLSGLPLAYASFGFVLCLPVAEGLLDRWAAPARTELTPSSGSRW